jgi:hypothetical protein
MGLMVVPDSSPKTRPRQLSKLVFQTEPAQLHCISLGKSLYVDAGENGTSRVV